MRKSSVQTKNRPKPGRRPACLAVLVAGLLTLAGCSDSQIRVYTVPSESAWKVPAGWRELDPDGMRAAHFSATSTNGSGIDVSIIPISLTRFGGTASEILNIWRQQMKLNALSNDEEAAKLASPVKLGAVNAQLHDMTSGETAPDGKTKARTLVAVARKDETMWFVKMTGEETAVTELKPTFLSFLGSINLHNVVPPTMPRDDGSGRDPHTRRDRDQDQAAAHDHASHPDWEVPSGWTEQSPGQILNAKFIATGEAGAKVDVNVSVSPGDGGGVEMNVNRWRNQLGLATWDKATLDKNLSSVDAVGAKALLVELEGKDARSGQPARLIGAIVPLDGRTWFYKMMGNPQVADREKAAFIKFVTSAKHPASNPNG